MLLVTALELILDNYSSENLGLPCATENQTKQINRIYYFCIKKFFGYIQGVKTVETIDYSDIAIIDESTNFGHTFIMKPSAFKHQILGIYELPEGVDTVKIPKYFKSITFTDYPPTFLIDPESNYFTSHKMKKLVQFTQKMEKR